jgi:GDPmannose 4,6-dehydratase
MNTAVVTGSRGQDGSYLCAHLERLGYKSIGIDVDSPTDLRDADAVGALLAAAQPREVYHLAAYHHSSQDKFSDEPELYRRSHDIHGLATLNLLDGIARRCPAARLFFAGSCHLFGTPAADVQNESTPFQAESIYTITKLGGLDLCRYYRHKKGVFASAGILYNHESPLRRSSFVSKKIVEAAVAIKQGRQKGLVLGDLDAEIDWGFAGDYVVAMHLILQLDGPDDFVIASGERHRVRDFVERAFRLVDLDWRDHVTVDGNLLRQHAHVRYFGDSTKLTKMTGWKPSTSFQDMVKLMVDAEREKHGDR